MPAGNRSYRSLNELKDEISEMRNENKKLFIVIIVLGLLTFFLYAYSNSNYYVGYGNYANRNFNNVKFQALVGKIETAHDFCQTFIDFRKAKQELKY